MYKYLQGIKDIVLALLASLIPLLPGFMKTPLEFLGITSYLEKSLDKYNSFESEKKKEKQYQEYAKKLEQNRPKSPSKTNKIDLTKGLEKKDDTAKQNPTVANEGRKVFDPETKQFKVVKNVSIIKPLPTQQLSKK